MTLTPPKIGDLIGQSLAQRLLEKNLWRTPNTAGENIASLMLWRKRHVKYLLTEQRLGS